MNIIYVTADLSVFTAEMYPAGKSGGCGLPVATQWRVRNERPLTEKESEANHPLILDLIEEVSARRYWSEPDGIRALPGAWTPGWRIKGTWPIYARLAWIESGQREWGRWKDEFQYQTAAIAA